MGMDDGIADGKYLALPIQARIGKSKQKETPFIEVGFRFDVNGEEKRCSWTGYLSEKTKKRTIETLKGALNSDGSFSQKNEAGVFTSDKFVDGLKTVEITVKNNEYNGKLYPRIEWVNEPNKKTQEAFDAPISLIDDLTAEFLSL